MGLEALREFVQQLEAVRTDRPLCAPSTPATPDITGNIFRKSTSGSRNGRAGRYGSTPLDPRRTLLQRRLEAAKLLAQPFAVRLEADGVANVKVLVRMPARTWGLPSCLAKEMERMVGLLVARTCASNHFSGKHCYKNNPSAANSFTAAGRGGITGEKHVSSVDGVARGREQRRGGAYEHQRKSPSSLAFDSRFQRSAVDPFGRPPRLEYIRPCLRPRYGKAGDRHSDGGNGSLSSRGDDDLPPGPWDGPPAMEGNAVVETGGDNNNTSTLRKEDKQTAHCAGKRTEGSGCNNTAGSSSCSPPTVSTVIVQRKEAVDSGRQGPCAEKTPFNRQRSVCSPHQHLEPDDHQALRNKAGKTPWVHADGKKGSSSPTTRTTPETVVPSRFTCRFPCCGAAFTKSSTLRTHERSHVFAPEYHRLRHAPQLFRDQPPAPSEGDGAVAAKFRLRTELPVSVQQELRQLQEESARRRRCSLLAMPRLPGEAATWAGVVSPRGPLGWAV